ncbi:MAG: succinate dehydrogenase/fumarate reductase iron-sulfur subunit [Scrofimicrobium sp.]
MRLRIQVWRQSPIDNGHWETHELNDLSPGMSILEVLDRLNELLVAQGDEAIAFDSDCREGICGACGITVDGQAHGAMANEPSCHQRLWSYQDGQTVRLEPMRAGPFPVLRDLMVDRQALDVMIMAGGFVSVNAGTAPESNDLPVGHDTVEDALDFAACIGCGACVAACPNGSANLFLGAKLRHLSELPLPSLERDRRAKEMVATADRVFGPCSNYGECAIACPAGIPLAAVSQVGRERLRAGFRALRKVSK